MKNKFMRRKSDGYVCPYLESVYKHNPEKFELISAEDAKKQVLHDVDTEEFLHIDDTMQLIDSDGNSINQEAASDSDEVDKSFDLRESLKAKTPQELMAYAKASGLVPQDIDPKSIKKQDLIRLITESNPEE
jgi:vacuolar-type H+-ATPase subunit I/STV1